MSWAGPLNGIRLTDFCWWGVGALCTRMLADFGAEVIKIEDRQRLDYIRMIPPIPGQVLAMGSSPGFNPNKFAAFPSLHAAFPMLATVCLLYTSPSPRDQRGSRMPSSA